MTGLRSRHAAVGCPPAPSLTPTPPDFLPPSPFPFPSSPFSLLLCPTRSCLAGLPAADCVAPALETLPLCYNIVLLFCTTSPIAVALSATHHFLATFSPQPFSLNSPSNCFGPSRPPRCRHSGPLTNSGIHPSIAASFIPKPPLLSPARRRPRFCFQSSQSLPLKRCAQYIYPPIPL